MSANREPRRVDRHRYRDERSRPREDERHNRRGSRRRSPRRDDRRTSFDEHRRYQRHQNEKRSILSETMKRTTSQKYGRERDRGAKQEIRSTSKDHATHCRARSSDRSQSKTGPIQSDSESDSLNKSVIDIPLPQGPNCCLVDMELSSTVDCILSSCESSPKRVMSVNDRLEMEFGVTMGSPPKKKKYAKKHEKVALMNNSEIAFQSGVPQLTSFPHAATMTDLYKDKFIPLPNFTPMFPAWQGSLMPIKPFSIVMPNNLASKNSASKFTGFRVQRPLVINAPTLSSGLQAHPNLPSINLLKPHINTDEPYIDFNCTSASNIDGQVFNFPAVSQMISKPLDYSSTISFAPDPQFSSPIKSPNWPVDIPVPNSKPIKDVLLFTPVKDEDLNKPHLQKNPAEIAKTPQGKEEAASTSLEAILKTAKEADEKNKPNFQENCTEVAKTPEGKEETASQSLEAILKGLKEVDEKNKPHLQENSTEIAKTPEGKEEAASPSLEAILKAAKEADEKSKKDREISKRDREIREKEMEQILLKKSKIIAKLPKDGSVPLYAKPISKCTLKIVPPLTLLKSSTVNCKKEGLIEKSISAKKKRVVFSDGVYPGHGSPDKTTHKPKPIKKLNYTSISIDLSLPPPPPPPLPPSPPPGTPPSHLILSSLLNPAPGHMWAPPKHPVPPYNPQAASQSEVMMRLGAYHRSMLAARKKDLDNMTFVTRYQEHMHQRNLRYVFPLANEYCWT